MTPLAIAALALLILAVYAALYALARAAGGADWHIDLPPIERPRPCDTCWVVDQQPDERIGDDNQAEGGEVSETSEEFTHSVSIQDVEDRC